MEKKQGKFMLFDIPGFTTWLADQVVDRDIVLIQNHHTWSPSVQHFTGDNHFSLLRGMENAHIERGFSEIAQNITIFPDGAVALCRSLDKIPAGIKGANGGGICIENVGNFDAGKDAMSDAQRRAITNVNALFCKRFSLIPSTESIVYHYWYDLTTGERRNGAGNTKTCPGTAFCGGNRVEDAETVFIPEVRNIFDGLVLQGPEGVEKVLFRGQVTADVLNVRDAPSVKGRIVKRLNRGVMVNVYAVEGNWVKIQADLSSWVNGRYLERV